ncbi:hypothetical protein AAVH_21044 [Aphelenchoides avenae]|nr:hypothetical protein AAVH_21044 [Aphelenchus avenae]
MCHVLKVLVLLYRYNRKKKVCARDVPLSGRYQYAENVATLAVLVPSILIWGVVCVVALMTEPFFYVAWVSDDRETQLFVNQFIYFLAALNSVVCPLAFVLKYRPLTNAFLYELQRFRLWRTCHTRSSASSVRRDEVQASGRFPAHSLEERRALALEATNEHFRQLQMSWWK